MPGSVCCTVIVSSGEAARHGGLLGESEIEDLGAAVRRHHDVGGLQVAMRDAGRVRGRHAVRDLHGDVEQASSWAADRAQIARRASRPAPVR